MAFNSLDAQRDAGEAYIASQRGEGWVLVPNRYDDGGVSGGTLDRPALKRLLADVEAGRIDIVVVYKVDRLSRPLLGFPKLIEMFERRKRTFVSITQSFNTTDAMGRMHLNIMLTFAQYEREATGERIRDKVAASERREFLWVAGHRSATRYRIASSSSSQPMPTESGHYSRGSSSSSRLRCWRGNSSSPAPLTDTATCSIRACSKGS